MTALYANMSIASGVLAVVCLIVTILLVLRPTPGAPPPARGGIGGAAVPHGAIADVAQLIEAFSKLAAALNKAGPAAIMALLTIFFGAGALVFATLSSATAKLSGA